MKLIIVRHGATDYNIRRIIQGHLDRPLNKQGLLQAQELGRELSGENIDQLISSDLARARSTTEAIIRNRLCTDVDYTPALRERHYGEFQGGAVRDLLQAKHEYIGDWNDFQPHGGESQYEFHERVRLAWQSIAERSVADTLLFSVHGGVAKSLITHAMKEDMAYRSTLEQDNCCLNILHGNYEGGFTATLINGVAHLSDPTGLEGL